MSLNTPQQEAAVLSLEECYRDKNVIWLWEKGTCNVQVLNVNTRSQVEALSPIFECVPQDVAGAKQRAQDIYDDYVLEN